MRKIELSLARDYVPSWTITDGIRELFQNALDQEIECVDNKASWEYSDGTLKISNKKSSLAAKTLLLGASSKSGDGKTVGQFGEGYKIATLVLLREGKQVTIYNYGMREVWRPRFVKSRRFDTEILTFFIDKEFPWKQVPDNDLTIEVSGITEEEWKEQIIPSNLHLQDSVVIEETTQYGDVLKADTHAGMVYVNGLYVCEYKSYKYGYNFKPGNLKLDRDRKLASDFDLQWLASKMWMNSPKVTELIAKGIVDVSYVSSLIQYTTSSKHADDAFEMFRRVNGPHAIPVTSQEEADKVPSGYKPIFVSGNYMRLITRSSQYEEPECETEDLDVLTKLNYWFSAVESMLTNVQRNVFQDIMEELKDALE